MAARSDAPPKIAAVHTSRLWMTPARLAACGMVAALAFAACSSDKDSSSDATTTTTAAGQSSASGSSGATTNTVVFAFQPQEVAVKVTQPVTWMTTDGTEHNIVDDGGAFKDGPVKTGTAFSHPYPTAGTFKFHCSIHPSMTGTVTVTA